MCGYLSFKWSLDIQIITIPTTLQISKLYRKPSKKATLLTMSRSTAEILRNLFPQEPRIQMGEYQVPSRFDFKEIMDLPYGQFQQVFRLFQQLHPQREEILRLQLRMNELRQRRLQATNHQHDAQEKIRVWGQRMNQGTLYANKSREEIQIAHQHEATWRTEQEQIDRQILQCEQEINNASRHQHTAPRPTQSNKEPSFDPQHDPQPSANVQRQHTPRDSSRPESRQHQAETFGDGKVPLPPRRSRSAPRSSRTPLGHGHWANRHRDDDESSSQRADAFGSAANVRSHDPPSPPSGDRFAKRPRSGGFELHHRRDPQSSRGQGSRPQPQQERHQPQAPQVLNRTLRDGTTPVSVPNDNKLEQTLATRANSVDARVAPSQQSPGPQYRSATVESE